MSPSRGLVCHGDVTWPVRVPGDGPSGEGDSHGYSMNPSLHVLPCSTSLDRDPKILQKMRNAEPGDVPGTPSTNRLPSLLSNLGDQLPRMLSNSQRRFLSNW